MTTKSFIANKPRPLPVIVMADTSGSMSIDGKIQTLNQALQDMLSSFANQARGRAEIHLAVITFGGEAKTHIPLQAAKQIESVSHFTANGGTPLGGACLLAKQMIEDKALIPSRSYQPIVILLSDGFATDDYQKAFAELLNSERAQKATRLALSIGEDADNELLSEFNNDIEAPLFYAKNASDIHRFFRAVTMSVATRSKSQTPNQAVALDYSSADAIDDDDDELDLDF